MIIQFKDFSCYYKTKKQLVPALKSVNLSVNRGELLCIVGESGSGKTTLLKSILGQCQYVEGELFVEGMPIEKVDVRKKNFAYIKQEIALYPHMTVYENVAFPLRVMGASQQETDKRVNEAAAKMGLDWLLTRKPRQLSVGQCQRVALARALIKRSQIMLFDEPFANLDPLVCADLRQLVKIIHNEYNPTVLFVTHNLSEAFSLGERIVVLENGCVAEMGTLQELKHNPQSKLLKGYFENATDNNG